MLYKVSMSDLKRAMNSRIRPDANGKYSKKKLDKLERLAVAGVHIGPEAAKQLADRLKNVKRGGVKPPAQDGLS